MIKDRLQKKLAIKFCASQGMVPFTEVVVRSPTGLEDDIVNITDVDVLGVDIGRSGVTTRLLFDCKTGAKQGGINRALWVGGLKSFVRADRAFVIQVKQVPDSHRLAAASFNVFIHTEETFGKYAASISPAYNQDITYLDNLDTWDQLVILGQNQPALAQALWHVTTQAALELSGQRGIRSSLAALMKVSGELDPAKPVHRLLFGLFVSAFLIFLTMSAGTLKEVFQFPMDKESFEQRLRYFIWEGRDNYIMRRQLRRAAAEGEAANAEYDLPEWSRFVELMRAFLDAPDALAPLAFLMKEIAFRTSTAAPRIGVDGHIREQFRASNRARQFIFATASYLVNAAKLPKDFGSMLEAEINALLEA